MTPQPQNLYTRHAGRYARFASMFAHQKGITALLLAGDFLRNGLRVLDAGCGTGFSTLACIEASQKRALPIEKIDAFDLTPAMLDRFQETVRRHGLSNVTLRQADVCQLAALPPTWTDYDLILSVSMLEYVPRVMLPAAVRSLRERLAPDGWMVIVITRKNPVTWLLIEKAWHAHRYTRRELADVFSEAGCGKIRFSAYPACYFWLNLANHVLIAR